MSCFHTQQQVRNRTKTVTRREGWSDLKPGEEFWMVEKAQGLKKGEKIKRIALCRCKSNWPEPLNWMLFFAYGLKEARLEGFPEMTGAQFVEMFCRHMGGEPDQVVNRIAFEYVAPRRPALGAIVSAARPNRQETEGT
jgi:hypothetical protein